MERIEFNFLKAEVEAQLREIEKIYGKIEDRKRGAGRSKAKLESLGYQLHNLYCAFEDLFKIIGSYFENRVEDLSRYHKELLFRMSLDVEGVRPGVIKEEAYKLLDELRAFRHLFRHAYSYELDYNKVKIVSDCALRLKNRYKEEVADFLKTLEE